MRIAAGFVVFVSATVPLGATASAQTAAPDAYMITFAKMDAVSEWREMVHVYRDGAKEPIGETPISATGVDNASSESALYDFEGRRVYSRTGRDHACSWMRYLSKRAPVAEKPL